MDDGRIRAVPLRKSGIGTSWGIPERGAGNDLEECMIHFLEIGLELALDVDDESGCDRGEQTGLFPQKKKNQHNNRVYMWGDTHEDERGVQIIIVLPHKVAVILVGFALELVVKLDTGASGRSKEVWEERWQCLEHSILQTGNEKRGHSRVEGRRKRTHRTHAFGLMVASPMMCYGELRRKLQVSSRLTDHGY